MQSTVSRAGADDALADRVYAKVTWRLVPLLFICYTLNYMDRVNIGYAQLQMKQDLHFTDAIYGLAAGIFFAGYFIFEVPSNILLQKIGARKTILRIMLCWGLVSAATMFVKTPLQFYLARFFLGVFEAGFFPGIILYLTYWYPPVRRARVVSLFMLATVAAGLIGGPTSGWIMQNMNGVSGLGGWQWMFVIEGLPSSLLGIVTFFVLTDRPGQAKWLNTEEKALIERDIASTVNSQRTAHDSKDANPFLNARVYMFGFILFSMLCGSYAIAFWLPTMIRELGVANIQQIGLYATIPDVLAAIVTILYSRHSDAKGERRWHFTFAALVAALGLCAVTLTNHSLGISLAMFALIRASIVSSLPVFWAMTTTELSAKSSVAGIALIASLSNLAGVFSPYILGLIKTSTGSLNMGFYLIAGLMLIAAVIVLAAVSRPSVDRSNPILKTTTP